MKVYDGEEEEEVDEEDDHPIAGIRELRLKHSLMLSF
jgi:hypothetical protein